MKRSLFPWLITGCLMSVTLYAQKAGKMVPKKLPEHHLDLKIDGNLSQAGFCYCLPEGEADRYVSSFSFEDALASTLKKAGLLNKSKKSGQYSLKISPTWDAKVHYKLRNNQSGGYEWESVVDIPMKNSCEENMKAHIFHFMEELAQWDGHAGDILSEPEIVELFKAIQSGTSGSQELNHQFITLQSETPLSYDYGEYYLYTYTYRETETDSYWKYPVSLIKVGDELDMVRARFKFATYNFGIVGVYREGEQVIYNMGNWNRLINMLQGAHSSALNGGPSLGKMAEQGIWRGEGTRISHQGVPPEVECQLKFNFVTRKLEETTCDIESWKNYKQGVSQKDYLLVQIDLLESKSGKIREIKRYKIVGFARFSGEKLLKIVIPKIKDSGLMDLAEEKNIPAKWSQKAELTLY